MLVKVINRILVINLDDEIGGYFGISDRELKNEIAMYAGQYDQQAMISINSPGGSVTTGMAIRGEILNLVASGVNVEIEVLGVAASIASVIALAGSTLKMRVGSYLMIHRPKAGKMVDYEEAESLATTLKKMNGDLVNIYDSSSNLDKDTIAENMRVETWFTAEEAIQYGFADKVAEPEDGVVVNYTTMYNNKSELWNSFEHVPEAILKHPQNNGQSKQPTKPNSTEENFMDLKEAYAKHPELENEVKALLSDAEKNATASAMAKAGENIVALTALTGGQMTDDVKAVIANGGDKRDLALAMVENGSTPVAPVEPVAPVAPVAPVNTAVIPAVAPATTLVTGEPEVDAEAEAKFEQLMNEVLPKAGN